MVIDQWITYKTRSLDYFNLSKERIKNFLLNYKLPKWAKISLISLLVTCIFLIITILAIDPNKYKANIEKLVFDQTQKTLILKGPLSLKFTPGLVLEAEEVILKEKPTSKRNLITFERLRISPGLRSLFPGKTVLNLEFFGSKFKSYFISHLTTKVAFNKSMIQFTPIRVNLSRNIEDEKTNKIIELDNLHIDTSTETPKFHITHSNPFALPLILNFLGTETQMSGQTHLVADITAEGQSLAAIKKSISGQFEMEIKHGLIHGVDLITSLKQARSILSTVASGIVHTLSSAVDSITGRHHAAGITPFNKVMISGNLKNGMVNNHVVHVNHKKYKLKGYGNVNLIKQTLNYRIEAFYKEPKKPGERKRSLNGVPLVINVTGSIEDPNIKPDMKSYLNYTRQTPPESRASNDRNKKSKKNSFAALKKKLFK
jgi:hypothetical protein